VSSTFLRGAAAACLLVAGATLVAGQTPAEQARLDRLEHRMQEFSARVRGASGAELPQLDSLRVGAFWIVSDSIGAPRLRDATGALDRILDERIGHLTLPETVPARIFVRFGPSAANWGALVTGDAQFINASLRRTTVERLTRELVHAVQTILGARAGSSFAGWRADVRLLEDERPLLAAANIELRTASVAGAAGCTDGHLGACAVALNLGSTSPEDLRRFIADRLRERRSESALRALYVACVDDGDDEACLTLLDRAGVPAPVLSTRARGTLLLVMRDAGGAGAVPRFFADTGAPIVPRLEAGAGMPIDSLLADWRETVMAYRPPPSTVPPGAQWLAFAWVGVLVILATRSTRWR